MQERRGKRRRSTGPAQKCALVHLGLGVPTPAVRWRRVQSWSRAARPQGLTLKGPRESLLVLGSGATPGYVRRPGRGAFLTRHHVLLEALPRTCPVSASCPAQGWQQSLTQPLMAEGVQGPPWCWCRTLGLRSFLCSSLWLLHPSLLCLPQREPSPYLIFGNSNFPTGGEFCCKPK